ncbi:MAG: TetR/AcrR family transcriptional regulator, partial [Myxococcota bacterium]
KAGVAKGTLYRYFESKADLYVAVLSDDLTVFLERMEEAAKPTSSALEQVRSIKRFYFSHWLENPNYFQIFWAIDNESVIGELPREVIDKVADVWEANLKVLNGVLEQGVADGEFVDCDTWEVANVLWAIADALIESDSTKARRRIRQRPLEQLLTHAVDTIIRGILVDPSRIELAPPSTPRPSTLSPVDAGSG